jgi:hypothetical protein
MKAFRGEAKCVQTQPQPLPLKKKKKKRKKKSPPASEDQLARPCLPLFHSLSSITTRSQTIIGDATKKKKEKRNGLVFDPTKTSSLKRPWQPPLVLGSRSTPSNNFSSLLTQPPYTTSLHPLIYLLHHCLVRFLRF